MDERRIKIVLEFIAEKTREFRRAVSDELRESHQKIADANKELADRQAGLAQAQRDQVKAAREVEKAESGLQKQLQRNADAVARLEARMEALNEKRAESVSWDRKQEDLDERRIKAIRKTSEALEARRLKVEELRRADQKSAEDAARNAQKIQAAEVALENARRAHREKILEFNKRQDRLNEDRLAKLGDFDKREKSLLKERADLLQQEIGIQDRLRTAVNSARKDYESANEAVRERVRVSKEAQRELNKEDSRFGKLGLTVRAVTQAFDKKTGILTKFNEAMKTSEGRTGLIDDAFRRFAGRVILLIGLMPVYGTALAAVSGVAVGAIGGVTALTSALGALAGVAVVLPSALLGIAGAIASIAATAGPAFGRIFTAVSEFREGRRESRVADPDDARQRARAEDQLARAREDGARRIADAERALARARRDGARSIFDAEKALNDERRRGIEAVEDAQRRLGDAQRDNVREEFETRRQLKELLKDLHEKEEEAIQDLLDARNDAAKDIADAEEALAEARQDYARREEDLIERLAEVREDAVERLADLERNLAEAQRDYQDARGDAEQALIDARIQGTERILELERRLAELRERNARDQRELELALSDARASLTAEQMRPGGLTALAGAFVGEAERDLDEFTSAAALAEGEMQRDIAQARIDQARRVEEAEENLANVIRDGEERILDRTRALNEERIDGPKRIKDAEEALQEFREDGLDRIQDLEEALAETRSNAITRIADAEKDLAKAQKAVIEEVAEADRKAGDEAVDRARNIARLREELAEARGDQARGMADAELDLERARTDAAERIGDAERNLGEARQGAARGIEDAMRALETATARSNDKLAEAKAKLDALAPGEKAVAIFLISFADTWDRLTEGTQTKILTGFTEALERLQPALPAITRVLDIFADSVLNLVDNLFDLFEQPIFQANAMQAVLGSMELFERGGRAAIFLGDALVTLMAAGRPLITFIAEGIESWARWVSEATRAAQASGDLATFFLATRTVLQLLVDTFGNLFSALVDIGVIGFPFGVEILEYFRELSKRAREFTESVEGQKAIKSFFEDATPVFKLTLSLLGAIFKTLFNIGRHSIEGGENSGIGNFIKILRDDFLPWLEKFAIKSIDEFGPILIDFFKSLGTLIEGLAGSSGPIASVIKLFTVFFKILSYIPPDILQAVLSFYAVVKVLGLGVKAGKNFKDTIGNLQKGFKALSKVMKAHPILLWAVIIGTLALIIIKHWDDITAAAGKVWEVIEGFFGEMAAVFTDLKDVIVEFVNDVLDFLREHWPEILLIITGPFGILTGLFTNAFGLRDAAKKGFEWFIGFFGGIWDKIWEGAKDGWKKITGTVTGAWKDVVQFFRDVPADILKGILSFVWDSIKQSVTVYWNMAGEAGSTIGGAIKAGWDGVVTWFTNRPKEVFANIIKFLWEEVKKSASFYWDMATGIGQAISDGWTTIKDWIVGLPGKFGSEIKNAFRLVWKGIWDGIKAAWSAILTRLSNFINLLIKPYNWVAGKLNLPEIPDWKPGESKDDSSFPPAMASGGIVKPVPGGLYRVAEAGHAEGVVPLDPRKRGRAWQIMAELHQRLGRPPGFARGGIVLPTAVPPSMVGGRFGGTHAVGSSPDNWQSDNALDLHVPVGTNLRAIESGVIGRITRKPQGGRFGGDEVYLIGDSGRVWWYKHGIQTFVRTGQRVTAGRVIGQSGFANAAHLHLGLGVPGMGPNYTLYPDPGQLLGYTHGTSGIFDYLNPLDLLDKARDLFPDVPGLKTLTDAGGEAGKLAFGMMKKLIGALPDAIAKLASSLAHRGWDAAKDFFGFGGEDFKFGELPAEMAKGNSWMNREWGDTPESGRTFTRSEVQRVLAAALRFTGVYSDENLRKLTNLAFESSGWKTFARDTGPAGWSGGPHQGLLQMVLGGFLAHAHPTMRNVFDPFHNAVASIRYQLREYQGQIQEFPPYATGGVIGGGRVGEGVRILGHVGEWVLNEDQQRRLARLAGMSPDIIKKYLFEGAALDPRFSFAGLRGTRPMEATSNTRIGGTVNQHVYTSQVEVDLDYLMRGAEMRLRTIA